MSAFLSFSTSSFVALSFKVFGKLSTNFFACAWKGHGAHQSKLRVACAEPRRTSTKFMLGMIVLTSLMTFAFCAESILVKVMVKVVFSFGASAAFSASGAAPAAAPAPAAGAADAAGRAMSTIFKRVCTSPFRSA